MNLREIYIILLFLVITIVSVGCSNIANQESAQVVIENEKLVKGKNILIKESDEEKLGFKPEYTVEIVPDFTSAAQYTLLNEQLDYLKAKDQIAQFKLIIDIDSNREKQFKLMIWDGEEFINFKKLDQLSKYYEVKLPEGKNYMELNEKVNLVDGSPLTELAFLIHDQDFPADIDFQYSPIRIYITNEKELLEIPVKKDKRYKEDHSLLQNKSEFNELEGPRITFLDEDKNVLHDKHLTDKVKFVSISQINLNMKESIIFYDSDGHIYESYFMMHPKDKQVVLPIPEEIKKNIGKKDFYMLINYNYDQAGLEEVHKIRENERTPYLNYSYSFKLGSDSKSSD